MPATSAETLQMLLEVSRLLSSKLELPELLTTVLELAAKVVDSESASLLLLDEATQELYFDVALGLGPGAAKVRLKLGQGIAGAVARSRSAEIINEVRQDPRWSPEMDAQSGFVTRSILAVPILLKDRLVGVVEAINKRGGSFTEADLRAFEAFASQAAVAIDNARLFSSLKEERFKLATVFAQMTDGAVLTDAAGRVLLANEASARLLGVELIDIGTGLKGMELTPALTELLNVDKPAQAFTAVRKEPTMLVLEGRATRAELSGAEGRLFVFRDGTETFRQDMLKRSFLSLISHKLKTPLAAVTGFADLLLDQVDSATDPMMVKAAKTISEQGGKVAALVDKLLRYTMLEGKEVRLKLEPVMLDEIIGEALKHMREPLDARQTQIDAPPCELVVLADRALLLEALKNLLDNALKFNKNPRPAVALHATSEGDWVALSVADTGPGIPPEDHERVFTRFHQVEKDFTGQIDGMGLGLPYVKKVIELHGGSVTLRSKLEGGTTVTLTLPRKRKAA